MFEFGQIIDKKDYTQAAIWCINNGAHLEDIEGVYDKNVIVKNEEQNKPTAEQEVKILESKTGLTRAVRELVLAENSGVSDYVRKQAQEIEQLAAPLREELK